MCLLFLPVMECPRHPLRNRTCAVNSSALPWLASYSENDPGWVFLGQVCDLLYPPPESLTRALETWGVGVCQ